MIDINNLDSAAINSLKTAVKSITDKGIVNSEYSDALFDDLEMIVKDYAVMNLSQEEMESSPEETRKSLIAYIDSRLRGNLS